LPLASQLGQFLAESLPIKERLLMLKELGDRLWEVGP